MSKLESNYTFEGLTVQMAKVLKAVRDERHRQEVLLLQGKFPWSCDNVEVTDIKKLGVLAEEFGKAVKEAAQIQEQYDRNYPGEDLNLINDNIARAVRRRRKLLRTELIQVAAVCVAWCEALDTLTTAEHIYSDVKAKIGDIVYGRFTGKRGKIHSVHPSGVHVWWDGSEKPDDILLHPELHITTMVVNE